MLVVRLNGSDTKGLKGSTQKLDIVFAGALAFDFFSPNLRNPEERPITSNKPDLPKAIDIKDAQVYRERLVWLVHPDNTAQYLKALKRVIATCAYGIKTVDLAMQQLRGQLIAETASTGPWGAQVVQLVKDTVGLFRGGQLSGILNVNSDAEINAILSSKMHDSDRLLLAQLAKEVTEMRAGACISSGGVTLWKREQRKFSEIHSNISIEKEDMTATYKSLKKLLKDIASSIPPSEARDSKKAVAFRRKVRDLIEETDNVSRDSPSTKKTPKKKGGKTKEKATAEPPLSPIAYGKVPTLFSENITGLMPITSRQIRVWSKLPCAMKGLADYQFQAFMNDELRSPQNILALEYNALVFLAAWRSTVKAVCNPAKYFKSVFDREDSRVERPWSAIRFICDYAFATLAQNLAIQPEINHLLTQFLPPGGQFAKKLHNAQSQDFLKSRRYAWEDRDAFSYGHGRISRGSRGVTKLVAAANVRYKRNNFKTYFESQVDLTRSIADTNSWNSQGSCLNSDDTSALVSSSGTATCSRQLSGAEISGIESGYSGSSFLGITLPSSTINEASSGATGSLETRPVSFNMEDTGSARGLV